MAKIEPAPGRPLDETARSPPPAEGPQAREPRALYRRPCPATRLPPRDRSTPPSTRSLNPPGSANTDRLFPGFRVFTVVAAFHVERPAKITDRDSAGHPFPARELIVMSSGPSRCWPVRGSPGSPESHRSCRSCAILQPGPATSPSSTQSEPPVSEPTKSHIPTGSRTYSPRRARPSAARFPLASRSRPHRHRPFRCLHRPANRFPRHHERSRRDRQPEPCSRGPRDRQDPNQTQPPGRAQTRRLEEQPRRTDPPPPAHPHLSSLTDIRRRASQPKDIAGAAA